MIQTFIIAILISLWLISPENTFAQSTNAQQKAQELVALLSKTKYKHKVKGNFEFEKYIDIKSEAVVKNNAGEYSGNYESESSKKENFSLKNAKIEGALLTATKTYENGKTEKFEAVFVNRTVVEGANPNKIEYRATNFGLGFVGTKGTYTERIFCRYKP